MKRVSWKLLLLTAALTTLSYADGTPPKDYKHMATPCPKPPVLLDGPYIGIQVGYNSFRSKNWIDFPGVADIQSNAVTATNGYALGALLGYGRTIKNWMYFGAEVYAYANTYDQTFYVLPPEIDPAIYTNQFYGGPTFGVSLLPGVKFTDATLAYVRLGYNRGLLKTLETCTFCDPSNKTYYSSGLMVGVGIETLITTNYSLRGEFDHMYFSSYQTPFPYSTHVSPSANQFTLATIYHFG